MSEAITATFSVKRSDGAGVSADLAQELAVMETTGHWPYPEPEPAEFARRVGSGHVAATRNGTAIVELSLPLENLGSGGFTDLFMAVASGATPALAEFSEVELVSVDLPPALVSTFRGPAWGVDRLKERMASDDDELLVGTIVKPVGGISADQVAADCYQAALAGVNFIKDDQKMLNPPYCTLEDRVRAVVEALRRAERETGRRRVLYAPHITARPDKVLELAEVALDAGAEALMINFVGPGFTVLEILAEADLGVPLYAHCGGKELMTRAPGQGASAALVAFLARLCGGDLLRVSAPGGDLVHSDPEDARACKTALTSPLAGIEPSLAAVSGGLSAGNLAETLAICGTDVLVLAGRSVANHPGGIVAGVTALRQAAQAFRDGIPVQERAKEAPELHAALA
jgi:ribulose 1,5-bisphosphate carboxylase large subunit-like protein